MYIQIKKNKNMYIHFLLTFLYDFCMIASKEQI